MIKCFFLLLSLFVLKNISLSQVEDWRFEIALNDRLYLPFFIKKTNASEIYVVNGKEKIPLSVSIDKDSLIYQFNEMDSYLKFAFKDSNNILGYWRDNRKGISFPLSGTQSRGTRFEGKDTGRNAKVFSSYQVIFGNSKNSWPAIGLFEQDKNKLSGTFLTETGDYRFLDGNVFGDRMYLSCFDGAHAFVFTAKIFGDTLQGKFYSGASYQTNWKGVKDHEASIADPNALTYLNETEYDLSSMKFHSLRFGRKRINFKNHPLTVLQIMGSWCPNCLDETNYFKTLHKKYNKDGLQIVSLGFESQKTKRERKKHLKKFSKKAKLPYQVLLAGRASKKEASKRFSMLNKIISFPTTLFVNRNGEIIHIHTGFNGPATGSIYNMYKKETQRFIELELLD